MTYILLIARLTVMIGANIVTLNCMDGLSAAVGKRFFGNGGSLPPISIINLAHCA